MGSCCNTKYLKSALAGVKVMELLSLMAAMGTVLFFHWMVEMEGTIFSRIEFFLLVAITTWVVELIIFIMLMTRMMKTLPVPWPLVNIIFGILFGIFLLIATGLLASEVVSLMTTTQQWPSGERTWETITNCEFISRTNAKNSCLAIQGGAGFGLLSIIIIIVDIILNSKELKTDFYIQGPTAQSKIINENMTISTVYKEQIE